MDKLDYMVQPTFQRDWVERGGLYIVLAFFLGGLGGGLYLISLYFDHYAGITVSFFIVAASTLGYLLHLGKPARFWRAFLKPQTSWISRGMIAATGFLLFVFLQLAPGIPWLSWLPWTINNNLVQALAITSAVVLITYKGFTLGELNAIPFWNTALMPMIFLVYSLLGGTGLTIGMLVGAGSTIIELSMVVVIANWLLVIAVTILGIYLWISYNGNPVLKYSVIQLIKGRVAPYFVGGVILVGLLVPLLIGGLGFLYQIPDFLILTSAICELAGVFFITYSILKAGVYAPVI
ncbi:DmsC/YnfH family molybdoenzyme membrane anchor subunit [Chloroflexota bacterium]